MVNGQWSISAMQTFQGKTVSLQAPEKRGHELSPPPMHRQGNETVEHPKAYTVDGQGRGCSANSSCSEVKEPQCIKERKSPVQDCSRGYGSPTQAERSCGLRLVTTSVAPPVH